MEKPVKNSKNISPFLLKKLESLLLDQKLEEAVSFLKRYNVKNITKWGNLHLDEWMESGKYDLIEVFFKTGELDLHPLLGKGFIKRSDKLILLLVKQGVFKCNASNIFSLYNALFILMNAPTHDTDKLIEVMFSPKDKTTQEMEFVMWSWNQVLNETQGRISMRECIEYFDKKAQIYFSKINLNNALPTSVLFKTSIKRL